RRSRWPRGSGPAAVHWMQAAPVQRGQGWYVGIWTRGRKFTLKPWPLDPVPYIWANRDPACRTIDGQEATFREHHPSTISSPELFTWGLPHQKRTAHSKTSTPKCSSFSFGPKR